ncbi:MAG: ABC transporter substrate-binding protein [Rubripirellula sp.]|nr:ABC transporter substrate-binding protein [Rubripirellula sp.]
MTDAQRIVSLLPGATEWVCELGLADRLVGISHECDFPHHVTSLPRVSRSRIDSTKSSREIDEAVRSFSDARTPLYELDAATLASLQPDLILTQTLCNVCAVSEQDVLNCISGLEKNCSILDLPARTFTDVFDDARAISEATGETNASCVAIELMQARIDKVCHSVDQRMRPTVTLLEWLDPLFCSGHWTPQVIQWAGGVDPIGQVGQPSKLLSFEQLAVADPDILLVACCGMDQHRTESELAAVAGSQGWQQLKAVRSQQVCTFDGSAFFNRPGPRLVDALEAVAGIISRWHSGQRVEEHLG